MGGKQFAHRCAEGFAYSDYEQTTALTEPEGPAWRSR
jgi:hypothetical protein